MPDEPLDDLDRATPPAPIFTWPRYHYRKGFDWRRAFEAGKRDRYTGDPADTCTCPGCVDA